MLKPCQQLGLTLKWIQSIWCGNEMYLLSCPCLNMSRFLWGNSSKLRRLRRRLPMQKQLSAKREQLPQSLPQSPNPNLKLSRTITSKPVPPSRKPPPKRTRKRTNMTGALWNQDKIHRTHQLPRRGWQESKQTLTWTPLPRWESWWRCPCYHVILVNIPWYVSLPTVLVSQLPTNANLCFTSCLPSYLESNQEHCWFWIPADIDS